jgi:hypothetical protein
MMRQYSGNFLIQQQIRAKALMPEYRTNFLVSFPGEEVNKRKEVGLTIINYFPSLIKAFHDLLIEKTFKISLHLVLTNIHCII